MRCSIPMRWLAGVAVAMIVALPSARACPMCKDGGPVASTPLDPADSQQAAVGLDFNTSVYAMLGVVAVVAAATGRAMLKAVRG